MSRSIALPLSAQMEPAPILLVIPSMDVQLDRSNAPMELALILFLVVLLVETSFDVGMEAAMKPADCLLSK